MSAYTFDKAALSDSLTAFTSQYAKIPGKARILKIIERDTHTEVQTNKTLSGIPFRPDNVSILRTKMSYWLYGDCQHRIRIFTDEQEIEELITDQYRDSASQRWHYRLKQDHYPLVRNLSQKQCTDNGLKGKHIACYGSHGAIYDQEKEMWRWQRACLLTTVEDLFTTSLTHNFLVPMLENAGAIVIQPRERDLQTEELIVDNPSNHTWKLREGRGWKGAGDSLLVEGVNPFAKGDYIVAKGEKAKRKINPIVYTPIFRKEGEYAVYVSYQTLEHSTEAALYTVVHRGIKTLFSVNQTMAGGTWVYLGTFNFAVNDAKNNYVSVSNQAKNTNDVISSDAIRFGGGMGNIGRRPINAATIKDSLTNQYQISGLPRYAEGARYWMQYTGIPDSVYSQTKGTNDYTDDFTSRGRWINYLTGKSEANPFKVGLGIPIHAGLCLHSDAGNTVKDSIVGTMLIYRTRNREKQEIYPTGCNRQVARDLADYIQTQICEDIQAHITPNWSRRMLGNESYAEARNPDVPTVLIELLSHQNFFDMQYGLDPSFQFIACRAIYKGLLKFMHHEYGTKYIVQPLPIKDFSIEFSERNLITLRWEPTIDTLENTATPTYYIFYTKKGAGDWDNGQLITSKAVKLAIDWDEHYEFRVVAGNEGGISLPSETLSACCAKHETGKALIVNGFIRVAAPESFIHDTCMAGFDPKSYAIPYKHELSYIGQQYDFDLYHEWLSDDDPGYGACHTNRQGTLIVGNTFDYPSLHGKALREMGFSYVSANISCIDTIPNEFDVVDVIMGKQKQDTVRHWNTLSIDFCTALKDFTRNGGAILMSGAYVAEDLLTLSRPYANFSRDVLHIEYTNSLLLDTGLVNIKNVLTPKTYQLYTTPNEYTICAERINGIRCVGTKENTATFAFFAESQFGAAVAYRNEYRSLFYSFPLESLYDFKTLYKESIDWLTR